MGGSTTQTTNNAPYAPAQPLIDQGLADAQALYNSGGFQVDPYQGNMVAGFSDLQRQQQEAAPGIAFDAIGANNAALGAANAALDPTQRSAAFDQVRQNTIASIMPSINASFANSGMTGSGLHAQNLARGLSQGLGQVENQAYQQGMNRSLQAAGMIPGLNAANYGALGFLGGVGGQQQRQSQAEIEAAAFRDQLNQSAEADALQNYLALTTGAGSQFGVSSTTQRNRPGFGSILGFGLQSVPGLREIFG